MTRTLKISAIALLGALVLWACGGGATGPKEVGQAFLEAMAEGDFSTAKDYATEDSKEALDAMASMAEMGGGETKKSEIVIGEVKEDGNTAVLSYTEDGTEKTLNLVKEGEDWKVKYSKGGPTEGSIGGAIDEAVEEVSEGLEEAMEEATEE